MKTVTANELKQATGSVMDQAQRQPVVVEKYGRPYAVVMSHVEFQNYEALKYAALKADIHAGLGSADAGVFDPEALIDGIVGAADRDSGR